MKAMRNYLDLAAASARVHKKQNLMTRLCILLAVYLVAAIFTMADMEIRTLRRQTIQQVGSWHAVFGEVDDDQIAVLRARPEVTASSRYIVCNYNTGSGWSIAGRDTAVVGCDENFTADIMPSAALTEGRWPQTAGEAVISENARQNGIALGDTVTLTTPRGEHDYIVCGFTPATALLGKNDALGLMLSTEGAAALFAGAEDLRQATALYLRLSEFCCMNRAIADMAAQLDIPAENVAANTQLMMLSLQPSQSSFVLALYGVAAVLLVLVLAAGVLMIAGTMNSNVANRTQFFGLLRCLGATPRQIMAYVRREALQWCAAAIPPGLALAAVTSWGLCALLKALSPVYFDEMPVFEISPVGLACGALAGLLAVTLAARGPAKRAAQASPLAAVTGNAGAAGGSGRLRLPLARRAEVTLGIHHAAGSKKNLLLIAGSFALSIVLFLGFSCFFDFMNHALKAVGPDMPDLTFAAAGQESLPAGLAGRLYGDPAVRRLLLDGEPVEDEAQLAQPRRLAGVQLQKDAAEADVARLRALAGEGVAFSDKRQGNLETQGLYLAMQVFVYGFLAAIALIAVMGIFNQLSVSAAARARQYGVMRAIGLSDAQLYRMLLAEAAVYAVCGCVLGLAAGLPLHYACFTSLVTNRWGDAWSLPWKPLLLIVTLVAASALLAVRGPARRLRAGSIIDTIAAP